MLAASQTIFAASQTMLAASQTIFAASQTTLAPSQTIFAASQTTLAASQTIFAVSQTIFAVSQTMLAASQTMLAASQTIFAVSQTTLAASQRLFPPDYRFCSAVGSAFLKTWSDRSESHQLKPCPAQVFQVASLPGCRDTELERPRDLDTAQPGVTRQPRGEA
jgi:hypothetical protein